MQLLYFSRNQQLFVAYIDNIDDVFPNKQDRRNELMMKYNFQCECELCSSEMSISMQSLQSDPDYEYIQLVYKEESLAKDSYNHDEIELFKERCRSFLAKNGSWNTTETVNISKIFCYLIRKSNSEFN